MKDFKRLERGLVLFSTALALGSALTVSSNLASTQAAEITISAKANISDFIQTPTTNKLISFTGPFTTKSSSGLFQGLVANSITNINLTFLNSSFAIDSESQFYTATLPELAFISFTDGSRFEIFSPFDVTRYSVNNNFKMFSVFEGYYMNNVGNFFRVGLFTINEIKNPIDENNFSLTLTNICCSPTPTPEPTFTGAVTIFGLLALGFAPKFIRIRKNLN